MNTFINCTGPTICIIIQMKIDNYEKAQTESVEKCLCVSCSSRKHSPNKLRLLLEVKPPAKKK